MESREFRLWVVLGVAAQADHLVATLIGKGYDVGGINMNPQARGGMGMSATFAYRVKAYWETLPSNPANALLNQVRDILKERKASYHTIIVVDFAGSACVWTSDYFHVEALTAHDHMTKED